jgi:acyl carrier protein phosphodiesterase
MNYLAHVFLSDPMEEAVIGAFLGDFVKGLLGDRYSPGIQAGILLHRRIDRYTDTHEITHASRSLVSRERRRFAGILVDVFYDHFLARHWAIYTVTPLVDFTCEVYTILRRHQAGLPERLQHILPAMARDDWLGSYRELWAIDRALNGLARRSQHSELLAGAVWELERNYSQFEGHFLAFFPELRQYVADCKRGRVECG